jgi:hypothetical protein
MYSAGIFSSIDLASSIQTVFVTVAYSAGIISSTTLAGSTITLLI